MGRRYKPSSTQQDMSLIYRLYCKNSTITVRSAGKSFIKDRAKYDTSIKLGGIM